MRFVAWVMAPLMVAALMTAGCSGLQGPHAGAAGTSSEPTEPEAASPEPAVATVQVEIPGWSRLHMPGKRATLYRVEERDGRLAIHARSDRSASMLRRPVEIKADQLSDFRFSWWVPALIPGAALGVRDTDDAPVRVVLAFDGDHSKLSAAERMQFELAELLTGERPPYATLMYVWDPKRPSDEIILSPRTQRIRKVVVETGTARLKRWCEYRRDVLADFRRAYGEEPGRLMAVGVMTDSDNTQTKAEAWYGDLRFMP